MTIQKLPLEIIQRIFEYVDTISYENLFICKRWHSLMKSIYFKEVYWRGRETIERLKENLSAMNENDNTFQPLPMTKGLLIYEDYDYDSCTGQDEVLSNPDGCLETRFTEREFLYILSLFPNLQYLDISDSVHRLYYMKALYECRERERLPGLEKIFTESDYDEYNDQESSMLSFAICYQFRQTLNYMNINYINKNLANGSSSLESLLDFKKLTTLEIRNDSDPNLTLFHLLQSCPNLSSLIHSSTFPIPASAAHQLTDILESKKQKSFVSQFLKHIKLSIPTFTAPYVKFFAYHCPKSLNKIEITMTHSNMYTWIDTTSMDLALKFCENLQKISYVHFAFEGSGRAGTPVTLRPDSKISLFYQILGALTKRRVFESHAALYCDWRGLNTEINMCDDLELTYKYGFYYEDHSVHLPVSDDNSFGESSYQKYSLPSPSSLDQLAKLKQLTMNIQTKDIFQYLEIYLKFAKSYCPGLRHFEIYRSWKCRFATKCQNSFDFSLENMTHILIAGAQFSQGLSNSITNFFPRVEVLNFEIDDTSMCSHVEEINVEISSFKHLHTLIIDIGRILDSEQGPLFLGLRYIGSNGAVQYLMKKKVEEDTEGCRYNFELVSASFMQERIDKSEKQLYSIYVEASPELARIELKKWSCSYATLDVSCAASEL